MVFVAHLHNRDAAIFRNVYRYVVVVSLYYDSGLVGYVDGFVLVMSVYYYIIVEMMPEEVLLVVAIE